MGADLTLDPGAGLEVAHTIRCRSARPTATIDALCGSRSRDAKGQAIVDRTEGCGGVATRAVRRHGVFRRLVDASENARVEPILPKAHNRALGGHLRDVEVYLVAHAIVIA